MNFDIKRASGYAADGLSVARIAGGVAIAKKLETTPPEERTWRFAGGVAALALTDWLDGKLGRYAGERRHGKWLDQLSDKLFSGVVMRAEVKNQEISPTHFRVKVARDIGVTAVRTLADSHGVDTGAQTWGKRKMAAEFGHLTIACSPLSTNALLMETSAGLVTSLNAYSGIHLVRSLLTSTRREHV